MKNSKHDDCVYYREMIQDLIDSKTEGEDSLILPEELSRHLSLCRSCSNYFKILVDFKEKFSSELSREAYYARTQRENDFEEIESKVRIIRKNRKKRIIASIAAILILGVGIPVSINVNEIRKEKKIIAEWNSQIVDSIYSEPILSGVEYSFVEDTESLSDWLLEVGKGEDYF